MVLPLAYPFSLLLVVSNPLLLVISFVEHAHVLLHNIQGEKSRTVKQMHFLGWPDFGCPDSTKALLSFVEFARKEFPRDASGPTLVHCR